MNEDNRPSSASASETPTTPVALIVSCQRLFDAFVVNDALPRFDSKWLNEVVVRPSAGSHIVIDARLFRGPTDEPIEMGAFIYFEGSDETYPVFHFPSESPRGAAAKVSGVSRRLRLGENSAVFGIRGVRAIPLAPSSWTKVSADTLDGELQQMIDQAVAEVRSILETLVGAYALYQYPLVWTPIYKRDRYCFVNSASSQATNTKEYIAADNFVPFRLNALSNVTDQGFVDDVILKAKDIVASDIDDPLAFLKDSMWHTDLRTRFLLQFWILEYAAEVHGSQLAADERWRGCVEVLQQFVAEKFPMHLDQFKSRKGELLRFTLVDKMKACCELLRVQYDDAAFKRAKRIRDSLSHGSAYEPSELADIELYVRELARQVLRRLLESEGVFLAGHATPFGDLPLLTTTYIQAKQGKLEPMKADFTIKPPAPNQTRDTSE